MGDFGMAWRRVATIVMAGTFVFGLALLASQHLQHIVGVLPYLLLLACPLMHFFGHGNHRHVKQTGKSANLASNKEMNHGY